MRLVGALYSVHFSREAITYTHRSEIYVSLFVSFLSISTISSYLGPYSKSERLNILTGTYCSFFLLMIGCLLIKKFCRERHLTIRYLKHYSFSSITLSRRYVISSGFTSFLFIILLVFKVLTTRVSLAVSFFVMLTNGPVLILLVFIERSLIYRISQGCYITTITITLGPWTPGYGISLSYSRIPPLIALIIIVLTPDDTLDPSSIIIPLLYLIFFHDSLHTNIRRYAECFCLNIGLVSNVRSELPPEVIREIVSRLHTFRDFKAAAGVSRTWQSVCLSISRRPQLPWLMLSETLSTDMRHFFSLCDNNRYRLQLSEVQGKRCWGSPHGWIVTLGPDYETHLLHPMKRVQIALPPLNTIRTLAATEEWFRLVHKFILLNEPSQDSSLLVIAIFGPVNRLAFARVAFNRGGEGAALNRRGQGQWAIVTNPDILKFNDVACFNDQLYGLCDNGKLVCLELDAPLAAEVLVIAPQPSEEEVGTPQKLYLMKSSENLFAVFHYGFHIPSEMRHETIYFLVYKFNFGELAWEEVTDDLEDLSVFVGGGNSWCIPTSAILCRSNCIYFTDDNWEWQRYPGVAYGGRDVGVFNMAQRVIQRLPFGKDNPLFYSRPIWVTPTMRLDELYVR